ncbi:hypothetical protein JOC54_001611 [Alkalihalobacillus xiaoxiensis]|uniref:Uncharacterized protein n=1 Tax=Shouchella xiaoxiensis TaxID=766895 RepID=A0ABS2SSY2_9BACI|nr:hypothetical protein [Shouchella xiaoxiensis]MBM7838355.1 hypothetical protein [Shouchella xiaoxiensis]
MASNEFESKVNSKVQKSREDSYSGVDPSFKLFGNPGPGRAKPIPIDRANDGAQLYRKLKQEGKIKHTKGLDYGN